MREIKFRGKRKDNGLWIEGDLLHKKNRVWIGMWYKPEGYYVYKEIEVMPEAVGEYTGRKDANGKEIYEGDILKAYSNVIGVVEYDNGSYYADEITTDDFLPYDVLRCEKNDIEVIGNIYENPELLKNISQNDG